MTGLEFMLAASATTASGLGGYLWGLGVRVRGRAQLVANANKMLDGDEPAQVQDEEVIDLQPGDYEMIEEESSEAAGLGESGGLPPEKTGGSAAPISAAEEPSLW